MPTAAATTLVTTHPPTHHARTLPPYLPAIDRWHALFAVPGRSLAEQVSETGTSPSVTAWSPKGNFSADGGHFRSDGTPRGTTPPVDVKRGDGRFNYYPVNLYSAMYFIITTEQK